VFYGIRNCILVDQRFGLQWEGFCIVFLGHAIGTTYVNHLLSNSGCSLDVSNCFLCPRPVGFDRLLMWICDFYTTISQFIKTKLFSYFTASQHFVFMYSFHDGPKIDAQYLESVKVPKQFQGVLIGTFHKNFLKEAELLLRTWRSFRSLGYSSHIWNPTTPFRVQKSLPWTLYLVSHIHSTLWNPLSFGV
jgi:hypothetical protein